MRVLDFVLDIPWAQVPVLVCIDLVLSVENYLWRNLVHERNCHRKHWERQTTIGSRSRNAKQFFLFLTLRSHCYWCRRPAAVGAIGEISSDHCCALFSFADHSVVGETSLAQANPTERLQMASAQLTLLTRVLRKIYSVHILACDFFRQAACAPQRMCTIRKLLRRRV